MELVEDNFLFNKIKLIDTLDVELDTTPDNFRQTFEKNVMDKQISYGLSKPKFEFHGKIKRDSFKIFRTYSAMDSDVVGAEGTYQEHDNKLKVTICIYLPMTLFALSYSIILTIDIIASYQLLTSEFFAENPIEFSFGIAIFFLWTISIPYLAFRKKIKKLKYDLERELHFWFRDQTAHNKSLWQAGGTVRH
jgi:predicted transcriptional regulator